MRRFRVAAATVGVGLGLLAGFAAGAPAHAAALPSGQPAVVVQNEFRFGMYYYEWACHYFGNSLVSGGAFSSYRCSYEYYQPDSAYYWMLYVR